MLTWKERYIKACSAFMYAEAKGNKKNLSRCKQRLRSLLREVNAID